MNDKPFKLELSCVTTRIDEDISKAPRIGDLLYSFRHAVNIHRKEGNLVDEHGLLVTMIVRSATAEELEKYGKKR